MILRALLGGCLSSYPGLTDLTRVSSAMPLTPSRLREMDETIDHIEQKLDEDLIHSCDTTVPIQLFTISGVKLFFYKLRLITKLPPDSKDIYSIEAFHLSLETMELQLSIWSDASLQHW